MAFPFDATDLRVRLDLDGSGAFSTDVTDYLRGSVGITRGLQSEGSTAGPASMSCTLDNSDHRFTRSNPDGPYFGQLVRNTPIRADLPHLITRLNVPLGVPAALSTPDTATLSITDAIDLRVDIEMDDWQGGGVGCDLLHKWVEAGNQRSASMYIGPDGVLSFHWTADGSTVHGGPTASAVVPRGPKRQVLRVTWKHDDGAGNRVYSAYAGTGMSGPWTLLGTQSAAGTDTIYDSTAPWSIGDTADGGGRAAMRVFAVQVWDGIEEDGGTLVSDLDLTAIPESASTVDDAQSNTWTPASGAELATRDVRYVGVVPSWAISGGWISTDAEASVSAADVLRRLGRSAGTLKSTYRRACSSTQSPVSGLVAYWPLEDAAGSLRLASGLPDGSSMWIVGEPELASDGTAFVCSDPLPKLTSGSAVAGNVRSAANGAAQLRLLLRVPAAWSGSGRLVKLTVSGTAPIWEVSIDSSGRLTLTARDSAGASLLSDGPTVFGLPGVSARLDLSLVQSGSDISWRLSTLGVGESTGGEHTGTLSSRTVGRAVGVSIAPDLSMPDVVVGHVTVQDEQTSVYDLHDQLDGYVGETAAERIARLAGEAGLSARSLGVGGPALGAQRSGSLLDVLREAETSDGGILHTPRGSGGIAYRSLRSMYSRDPVVTLPLMAGGISLIAPVDDDQQARNLVTVSRVGGSSQTAELTSGELSTQDPPDGIGLYDASLSVTLAGDGQLADRASWELHAGTVAEQRFPVVAVNLAGEAFIVEAQAGTHDLAVAVRDLDIGDRLVITDPPAWAAPDDIDQVIIGLAEEIGQWEHRITPVCRPASTFHVGRYADSGHRYGSAASTVNGTHSAGAGTLSVAIAAGALWGHGSGDFDVRVGGRRLTVTAVSGASSPQTFTIDGGLPADLSGGEAVVLADPSFHGL